MFLTLGSGLVLKSGGVHTGGLPRHRDRIVTGRSMDWKTEIGTSLWAFPRGMKRNGEAGPGSPEWTSKYGSVVASGFDISTTDGVNEAGLAVNLLWLAESQYPAGTAPGPAISVSVWGQYVLDNFGTVADAVAALTATPLRVATARHPGTGSSATVHLAMSDRERRQRHRRVRRRTAGDPPRPAVPGDDELADLRQTACDHRVLGGDRRNGDAARHQPGRRPVRARVVLHRRGPQDRRPVGRGRRRAQRDAQRLGPVRHRDVGRAQHLLDALADGRRPHIAAVLLRIGAVAQHVLGGAEEPRLLRGRPDEDAEPRRRREDGLRRGRERARSSSPTPFTFLAVP